MQHCKPTILACTADHDHSLQAYWNQYSAAKSEPLGQDDLPHQDMTLALPVTPHTEHMLLGSLASAQQSTDAHSAPMALMPFPLHSLPEFAGDLEAHGEAVLLPDGFSSSMGTPNYQNQVCLLSSNLRANICSHDTPCLTEFHESYTCTTRQLDCWQNLISSLPASIMYRQHSKPLVACRT